MKTAALAILIGISFVELRTLQAQNEAWRAKYPICQDYSSLGTGLCASQAALPLPITSTLLVPDKAQPKNPVDEYLENYGKPPREFVEFYLNPSPDNATKWVGKYQSMLEKGKDIAAIWGQAERNMAPSQTEVILEAPQPVTVPVVQATKEEDGIVNLNDINQVGLVSGAGATIKITYYFSANCPYCTQMTPVLDQLSRELNGKLELTCVDVTPENPQPKDILGKLGCAWRLPSPGEVELRQVTQTPTLFYQIPTKPEAKLSGYVPLEDMRAYLK